MTTAIANVAPQEGTMYQWTPEQVETIKRTVAKDASGPELEMFLHLSRTYGLDPFAKEIWFIKMDRTPTIFTSRDGYLKIANRDPHFQGMEADVVYEGDSFRKTKDGVDHVYGVRDRGQPIGAYCFVHRDDRDYPTYIYAPFKDYNKGGNWNKYPHAMILKVAEAQALKRAFCISGLVTREEIEEEPEEQRPVTRRAAAPAPQSAEMDRKSGLWHRLLDAFDGDVDAAKALALKVTGGRGSKEWTEADMSALEEAIDGLTVPQPQEVGTIIPEMLPLDEPPAQDAAAPIEPEVVEEEPETPEDRMRAEIQELLGSGGLDLSLPEREQFVWERTKKTDLKALSMGELSKVARDARGQLEKRAKVEE